MGDEELRSYCCQFREVLMQIHDDIPFHRLLECFIRGLQYWPEVCLQMNSYFQQGAFDNWMQVFHMVKDITGKINHSQPTSEVELDGAFACAEHDDDVMIDLQSVASEESEVCAYCDLLGHTISECQVLDFHNLEAAKVEACSYCSLTGHKIGECQVLEYCKLHNLCTYCKMPGHRIQDCQQANDFHRDFHEHQRQKFEYEVQRPNFSYAQEHVSDLFYLPESSDAAYSIQKCMSNEEGSEKTQNFVDMPEIRWSCFEDPWHPECQKGVHRMPMPQITEADPQVDNPAPKDCDGDDEVICDIADLFEEPVHEEQGISASVCHLKAMNTAYNNAISLSAFNHRPTAVCKAPLPITASMNFSAYNCHPPLSTKIISFDHNLPLPKLSFSATASLEPIATQEDSTNAITNADRYPIKSILHISTFKALSTVDNPTHSTAADLSISELLCLYLPTCSPPFTCFPAQKNAPLLLPNAQNSLSKAGIG